jgi:predicted phosphate transport protein (TIGR00153 family)
MVFSRGKKDKFSEILVQITDNLQETAQFFLDQDISNHHELQVFLETIKEHELIGDTFVHTIIKELNETFITPIDREDILQLAVNLDDVLDGIEHIAGLLEMYSVTKPTDQMKKFVQKIYECSIEISGAIDYLSQKKLTAIAPYSQKIKEIEDHTDNLLRIAVKNLFATVKDPIKIIQYKEIYEALEGIVDDCRSVANTLDSIIMKNA